MVCKTGKCIAGSLGFLHIWEREAMRLHSCINIAGVFLLFMVRAWSMEDGARILPSISALCVSLVPISLSLLLFRVFLIQQATYLQ